MRALLIAVALSAALHASPDAVLAKRVRHAIAQQLPEQAKHLKVDAKDGAVTLTGSFYPETEQRITGIAKHVEGVKSVVWKKR